MENTEMHFSSLARNSAGSDFFLPIEKTASLAKQEKTRRGRRAFSSPMIPQSSLSSMRRENGTRRANKKAETDLEIQ